MANHPASPMLPTEFWQQVRNARHRFLGLDYDGTLAPFAIDPMQARPLSGIADLLRELSASGHTRLAIISGRPVAEVLALLDHPPLTVVGNHGFEIHWQDGSYALRNPSAEQRQGLTVLRSHLENRGYGGRLEVKLTSLALHTRGMESGAARMVEQEFLSRLSVRALSYGLECRQFNGGVEIRCRGWTKGDALMELLKGWPEERFAVYVGDDDTDEDAFAALAGRGVGIRVGSREQPTAAAGLLPDCAAVADFLQTWQRTMETV